MGRRKSNLAEVFAKNSGIIDEVSGCMNWQGSMASNGYGIMFHGGKCVLAHRYAFKVAYGLKELTRKQHICHICDNPRCINPLHLFLGTALDNMRDKVAKGRHVAPTGMRHGMAKLTESDVISIRQSDAPAKELAKQYGVHEQHIRLVRRRKSWTHV